MHFRVNIIISLLLFTSGRCLDDDTTSITSFSRQNLQVSQANIIAILYVRSRLACGMECDRNENCTGFFTKKKEGSVNNKNGIICTILQEQPELHVSGGISVYSRVLQSEKMTSLSQETTPIPEPTTASEGEDSITT